MNHVPKTKVLNYTEMTIIANKIQCKHCLETIESKHRYNLRFCQCGKVAVDGGKDYLKRLGYSIDYTELSEFGDEDNGGYLSKI